jgi:hypothetical protein
MVERPTPDLSPSVALNTTMMFQNAEFPCPPIWPAVIARPNNRKDAELI